MKKIFLALTLLTASISVSAQTISHTVQRGETIESIAQKYSVNIEDLKNANPDVKQYFYTGMKLNIPAKKYVSANPQPEAVVPSTSPVDPSPMPTTDTNTNSLKSFSQWHLTYSPSEYVHAPGWGFRFNFPLSKTIPVYMGAGLDQLFVISNKEFGGCDLNVPLTLGYDIKVAEHTSIFPYAAPTMCFTGITKEFHFTGGVMLGANIYIKKFVIGYDCLLGFEGGHSHFITIGKKVQLDF